MCTVSFVSTNNGFVITSNRDEQISRVAEFPKEYQINGIKIFYPKDPAAGGTWYAVNQNGNVVVLLNGADEKHVHNPPYARSRGLVVLEIASSKNTITKWEITDLEGVEPFTIVLFDSKNLFQMRWNGTNKSAIDLALNKVHFWSSATLYNSDIRIKRQEWFNEFLSKSASVSARDLLYFHENTHAENRENGLIINRNDTLKTLSITQAIISKKEIILKHKDLVVDKTSEILISIQ